MFLKKISFHHILCPLSIALIFSGLEVINKISTLPHALPHWLIRSAAIWGVLLVVSRFVNLFFMKVMPLKDFRLSYPLRLVLTGFFGALIFTPFFKWLMLASNGHLLYITNYMHPTAAPKFLSLRNFYVISLIIVPLWTLFNIRWYSYKKRVADIVAKKEIAFQESPYQKFIYKNLVMPPSPSNDSKDNLSYVAKSSELLAVVAKDSNQVVVYTDKGTRTIDNKNQQIINKIKTQGGVQVGENIWIKPTAVMEVKPNKDGYGFMLSSGQMIPISNGSGIKIPKALRMERIFDDQQRQRV